jgi:hypothetical protein
MGQGDVSDWPWPCRLAGSCRGIPAAVAGHLEQVVAQVLAHTHTLTHTHTYTHTHTHSHTHTHAHTHTHTHIGVVLKRP